MYKRQASEKEYDRTKYESISHYFQQQLRKGKITEPYVDDITWNDLDLDEVYQVMDHTTSSVGAEYLYYLLRTPVLSAEKLKERDRLMEFFTKNEEERLRLQYLFYEIDVYKRQERWGSAACHFIGSIDRGACRISGAGIRGGVS